jgi:hypothetical protein
MSSTSDAMTARWARWRAPMLNLVFNLVMFESLSGFLLFFARGFLSNPQLLGAAHWWLGLVLAVPYSVYQWRHYRRVRGFNDVLQYQIGLTSFFTMAAVIVSGVILYFLTRDTLGHTVVDLFHIMLGFAFLILITSHLVLVFRVGERESRARGARGFRALVLGRALWVPLAIGTLLVVGLLVL